MKKIIALILSICMVCSMAACSSGNELNASTPVTTVAVEPTSQSAESTEATSTGSIDTNEKLLSVEITIPLSFFEGEDMSTFDADAYAEENGFKSATVNDDNTVTIVMSKSKHRELLDETKKSLEEGYAEILETAETSYIKEIVHNDDFSVIDIKVVRSEYENAFDLTPFVVGVSAAMYQAFMDMEYHCEVNVVDVDTGDIISTTVYPDALNEQQ